MLKITQGVIYKYKVSRNQAATQLKASPCWPTFIKLKGLYQLVGEKRHLTDL